MKLKINKSKGFTIFNSPMNYKYYNNVLMKCYLCTEYLNGNYIKIVDNLKDVNLLPKNFHPLCCFCYSLLYETKYVIINFLHDGSILNIGMINGSSINSIKIDKEYISNIYDLEFLESIVYNINKLSGEVNPFIKKLENRIEYLKRGK